MPRTTLTKKKIFYAAIDCFASKNYKLCTMQELAAAVGIKAPSLYKHYACKEDILNEIMEYYKINFNKYRTPIEKIVGAIDTEPVENIISMLFYDFGTQNEYNRMMKISRIIMDMKFENEEASRLYDTVFIEEPQEYLYLAFSTLIEEGKLKKFDYKPVAFQMMAFSHMLFVMTLVGENTRQERDKMYVEGVQLLSRAFVNAQIMVK